MAGDINLREQIILLPADSEASARALTRSIANTGGRIMHQYGPRVQIVELPRASERALSRAMPGMLAPAAQAISAPDDLDPVGRFGLRAMQLRESPEFIQGKANRPYNGLSWHEGGTEALRCTDQAFTRTEALALAEKAETSARLTGSVAVGIIIVEGPTKALQFTEEERAKVIAEVQNGLGWLGSQNPAAAVVWKYDIQIVRISEKPGGNELSFADKESLWRDPVMKQLGYGTGMNAVYKYVEENRSKLQTDWTYCAFFTKYPLGHFAYASVGGPRLVMHYQNDGWGPDNIDRVFTHETGHIFGAPDEYKESGCNCGGQWGYHKKPNTNCDNCNPESVDCIMKGNTWNMCAHTPYHLGFPIAEQRYSGVWRAGSDRYGLWVNANWTSFLAKWKEWGQNNLRLTDLKITTEGPGRRYHGVWREGTEAYGLWVNADWDDFKAKWEEWAKKGLRLTGLEIIPGSKDLYSGVWTAGNDAYALWVNADWSNFKAKWEEWGKKGLRLVDMKVVNKNGQVYYSGVWRAGSGKYGIWVNSNWESFKKKWEEWAEMGLRLIDMEIAVINGERRYFGVWGAGQDGYGLWVNADWNNFQAKWEEWGQKGYRLIDLDVYYPDGVSNSSATESLSLGLASDENGLSGIGFLSSEDITGAEDTDLATGYAVLTSTRETEVQAPAAIGFGSGKVRAAATPEEEGLGGMAEAPSFSAGQEDGQGGIGGETPLTSEENGLGGAII